MTTNTVKMTGTAGAAGVNGSGPGVAGTAGGAGGGATTTNTGNGVATNNLAYATGGGGGVGGSGGGGAGTGGAAGNGGVGGAANASTAFSSSYAGGPSGGALAYGGAGGDAGKPGNYNVTGAGAAGIGGAGGTATASDSVTGVLSAGGYVRAEVARSTGGAGGRAFGPGGAGGAGGIASGSSAQGSAYTAYVSVNQIGGAGGAGLAGASGGVGAASTLTNAVTGRTNGGTLGLYQIARGGAGGASSGGTAGAGGAAVSSLTFDDVTANPVHAYEFNSFAHAYGGAGGTESGGSTGGAGGQANATIDVTGVGNTGGSGVSAEAIATGGAGGAGVAGGVGGTAKALATGISTKDVHVVATAHGGQGVTVAGHASAKTKSTGTIGTFSKFSSSADTSLAAGQPIQTASANAGGSVDGSQNSKAKVVIGAPAQPFESQGQAVALETAAPDAASTTAVLAANANIKTAFGASPEFFAIDELGGAYAKSGGTAPQTTTETVNLTVDLTQLASRQNLVAGFYNATELGAGFTSLTFTLTGDGTSLVNKTFTTLASAQAFFSDTAMSLGSLSTGALGGNILTLVATFSITTDAAGSGFYAQMILGDPPGAAPGASSRQQFVHAMAGLGKAAGTPPMAASAPVLAQAILAAGHPQFA